MTPVDQTTFGFPGGNCFTACVATILDLPLESVPYFMGHGEDWWEYLIEWLAPRGWYPIFVNSYPPPSYLGQEDLCRYYLLGGQSPRAPDDPGKLHSVVAFDTEIVHDPHPSRDGLLTRQDCIFFQRLEVAT